MDNKIGRNDPCPCGSGKKYKQCCMNKSTANSHTPRKFKATLLSQPKPVNLMERTFGDAIASTHSKDTPDVPPLPAAFDPPEQKQ